MYDSDTVSNRMKDKMRRILSKHKDGILCNDFLDVYGVSVWLNFFLLLFIHITYKER